MAARKYTGNELITAVRDTGMIPDTGSTGSEDADLLKYINQAIATVLVPRLIATREDYFVQRARTAVVSGTNKYRIPHRAAYGKLRDVWFIDNDSDRIYLPRTPEEEMHRFSDLTGSGDDPVAYFIEGEYVVLLPEVSPTYTGYLEFVYFTRPGEVVKTTSAGVVSSVAGKVITCTADVSSVFSIGDTVDVHSPYSGAELKCWDLTVTNVSTTDVTVSQDIDGSTYGTMPVTAGDYLCIAEECVVPSLPRELHPLVARAAAVYIAESIGDTDMLQFHSQLLEKNLTDALKALETRIEGRPWKVTGRTGPLGW